LSYSLKYRLSYWFNYPRRWLKRLLLLTGALFWLLLLSSVAWLNWLLQDVPDAAQLNMKNLQQQAINRTEQRLEQASGIDVITPQWLPLDAISRNLVYAVVLSEDADFFSHQGIDYDALLAALGENIKQREWKYGASTISQQVAKNLFLWSGRSYIRKGLEAWFTLGIELIWPKQRILEMYLNIAEWDHGVYGVEAAAQHHFGVGASYLSSQQSAQLAAVLPSPLNWDAASPPPHALRRANWIRQQSQQLGGRHYLDRMEAGKPLPDWLTLRYWRNRLEI